MVGFVGFVVLVCCVGLLCRFLVTYANTKSIVTYYIWLDVSVTAFIAVLFKHLRWQFTFDCSLVVIEEVLSTRGRTFDLSLVRKYIFGLASSCL